MVKDGLRRRITDLEREQRRAQSLGCDRATLVRGPGTDQVGTAKHLMQINYHVLEEFITIRIVMILCRIHYIFCRYRRQVFLQVIYRVATSTGHLWTPSFIMKNHVLSATHIHDAQSSKAEPKLE